MTFSDAALLLLGGLGLGALIGFWTTVGAWNIRVRYWRVRAKMAEQRLRRMVQS